MIFYSCHCKRKGNQSVTKLKLTPVFQSGKTCIILDKLFDFQIYKMFDEETHDVQLSQSINPDEKWK